jgi:hydroxymethylpyrimidine/phosphomethylpyrimidine kinase
MPDAQPIALTIAGSDSSGGAGIQADLKTFAALGVYGASVITALTAQNTTGVSGIHDVPPEFVAAQIDAVFSDLEVAAVKIGMVSQAATIEAIVAGLDRWKPQYVVLDPVMIATSGAHLLASTATELLRKQLLPRATVITPNLPEAGALLGASVATDRTAIERQARDLLRLGARAVLIKGGHGEGAESIDYLVTPDATRAFSAPRITTSNTHGTGCTLSSAIAAGLAKDMSLEAAIDAAKRYVTAAIVAADTLAVGRGHGPLQHFHAFTPTHPSAERKT